MMTIHFALTSAKSEDIFFRKIGAHLLAFLCSADWSIYSTGYSRTHTESIFLASEIVGEPTVAQSGVIVVDFTCQFLFENFLRISIVNVRVLCWVTRSEQGLKVLLLSNSVFFNPIHSFVGLFGPSIEIENFIALINVPKLDPLHEVNAKSAYQRQVVSKDCRLYGEVLHLRYREKLLHFWQNQVG